MRGYLSLIRMDSITHMYGLAVHVKEGLHFAWDLSLKTLQILTYVIDWFYFTQCLTSFLSYFYSLTFFVFMNGFYAISSNIDEVLSINPSAVFVFGDFIVHHKDWLTYSGRTDRPGEFCYNFFFISNDLTQVVNFPSWIPGCDSHSPALLGLILFSNASICFAMVFLPLENSDVVVSIYIDFMSNSKRDASFHCIACDYSHAN